MAAKKKSRKSGRPRVPANERRTHALTVRFTSSERDAVQRQAHAEGLDAAVWIRRVVVLTLGPDAR